MLIASTVALLLFGATGAWLGGAQRVGTLNCMHDASLPEGHASLHCALVLAVHGASMGKSDLPGSIFRTLPFLIDG